MSAVALVGGILFLVVPLVWNSPFTVVFTSNRQVGLIVLGFGVAFGAAAYLVARHAQAKSARFQQTGVSVKELRSLSPDEFEDWCAGRLREQGYQVTVVGGRGDHGVDLIAARDGTRMVVQCKRWYGGRSVGESEIRDLAGAMQHEQAASGMVLTTGQFTPAAVALGPGKADQTLERRAACRCFAGGCGETTASRSPAHRVVPLMRPRPRATRQPEHAGAVLGMLRLSDVPLHASGVAGRSAAPGACGRGSSRSCRCP